MLEDILQDFDLTEGFHSALLEHIVISNTDCSPDQRSMFVSTPHAGTESIDLLMCAASMGADSVLSALIRAGMKFAFPKVSLALHCLADSRCISNPCAGTESTDLLK